MIKPIAPAEFNKIVTNAIASIPSPYQENLTNIAFFVEQQPSPKQRTKLNLRPCDSLFGLYEGVPLPDRRGGYALTLPDKITIFKASHEIFANNIEDLREQVLDTVWHEVAHYYGLNHQDLAAIKKGS